MVHLRPRQWLESEDELVPIGPATRHRGLIPRADRNGSAQASGDSGARDNGGHASTWLGTGEQTTPIAREPAAEAPRAREASDFWGEDAAYVQDALEVPDPEPVGAASPRTWNKAPVVAAVAVAAAAVIAAAVSGLSSAPTAPRRSTSLRENAASRSTAAQDTAAAAREAATAALLRATRPDSRQHRTAHAHLRPRAGSTSTRTRPRRHRGGEIIATTAVVRYVAPPAPSTDTPVTPAQPTNASPPSRAGPSGIVSLLGAGTSSSG